MQATPELQHKISGIILTAHVSGKNDMRLAITLWGLRAK
jgi:hypothetical protein